MVRVDGETEQLVDKDLRQAVAPRIRRPREVAAGEELERSVVRIDRQWQETFDLPRARQRRNRLVPVASRLA
jgi:hypothetical protein